MWIKADLCLPNSFERLLSKDLKIDIIISCIASRTGDPKDSFDVDYKANKKLLDFGEEAKIKQFILLSAICVQRPKLCFQYAKLKFENELENSRLPYTIIRPTAFFKSLSGQIERIKKGKKFIIFNNGDLTRCKPISAKDLAIFIFDCTKNTNKLNKILPIGGPGPALNSKQIGEIIFKHAGKKPKFKKVSPNIFKLFKFVFYPFSFFSKKIRDKLEFFNIAYYYATESMLVYDFDKKDYSDLMTPEFGKDTLNDFYKLNFQNYEKEEFDKINTNRIF